MRDIRQALYIKSRHRGIIASMTRFAYVVVAAIGLAACTNDGYDTGDGNYSYLTAEMALLHTNSDKAVASATLDDGTMLNMAKPFVTNFANKADTVYRALLYYDKSENATSPVTPRGVTQVPVLNIKEAEDVQDMHTDPLGIESMWMAKNGSYLNFSLLLKSGTTDDNLHQFVGIVSEGMSTDGDGKRHLTLRMYHNQNNVPQYYTIQRYVSIDMSDIDADILDIHVNTYNGEIVKSVVL